MVPELIEKAKNGALDLAAREEMGLLSLDCDERDFIDLVCEIASEHVPPPKDRAVESFDLLVGATISAFFAHKAYQALKHLESIDE